MLRPSFQNVKCVYNAGKGSRGQEESASANIVLSCGFILM